MAARRYRRNRYFKRYRRPRAIGCVYNLDYATGISTDVIGTDGASINVKWNDLDGPSALDDFFSNVVVLSVTATYQPNSNPTTSSASASPTIINVFPSDLTGTAGLSAPVSFYDS